jgi:hypothetical protein
LAVAPQKGGDNYRRGIRVDSEKQPTKNWKKMDLRKTAILLAQYFTFIFIYNF